MRIAIDYDDTYTRDPEMWNEVIVILKSYGHDVRCVTSRRRTQDNVSDIISSGIELPLVFCGYNAKAEFARAEGLPIDIWIDDHPYTIDPDGREQKPQYEKWKQSGR